MVFKKQWIAFRTLSNKEILRVFDIWIQAFIPSSLTMTLYFIIFGGLVGAYVPKIDGYSYMQYIAPGLIIMPTITAAYSNTGFSFFIGKFHRSIDEFLISPMSNHVIILGYLIGSIFRAIILSVIVTIIALIFTKLHIMHFWIIFLTIFLSSTLFGLFGLTNAIIANKFDDISLIPVFILTPLTYLGGVFYSVNELPPFWHHLSFLNPILYIVSEFRYGFLGLSDSNSSMAILILVMFVIGGYFLNLYLLRKGVGIKQ